jgi:hypothetical protein
LRVESLEELIDKEDEEIVKAKQDLANVRKAESAAYNESLIHGRSVAVSMERIKERDGQTYKKYWDALDHINRLKRDVERSSLDFTIIARSTQIHRTHARTHQSTHTRKNAHTHTHAHAHKCMHTRTRMHAHIKHRHKPSNTQTRHRRTRGISHISQSRRVRAEVASKEGYVMSVQETLNFASSIESASQANLSKSLQQSRLDEELPKDPNISYA